MSAHPVATLHKNAREEVRIALSQFKGYDLVDMRVWTEPRNGASTERIPTHSGIAIRVELLPQLIEALRQAEAAARHAGLLS
jgi:hypothetical protein